MDGLEADRPAGDDDAEAATEPPADRGSAAPDRAPDTPPAHLRGSDDSSAAASAARPATVPAGGRAADTRATEGGDESETASPSAGDPLSDGPSSGPPAGSGAKPVVLGGAGAVHQAPGPTMHPPDNTLAVGRSTATDAEGRGVTAPEPGRRPDVDPGERPPRHLRSATSERSWRRPWVIAVGVPVIALALLIVSWAIDSAALSGQVVRNLQVAERSVGGLNEESLPEVIAEVAEEFAERPVLIRSGNQPFETTAGQIGLTVDQEATAREALEFGRGDALVTRPFRWLASFFGSRSSPVHHSVSEAAVAEELLRLQAGDITRAQEPAVELTDQGFVVTPGRPGDGIDARQVAEALPTAADEAEEAGETRIQVEAADMELEPRISDAQAQQVADRANALTADGLTLVVEDTERRVEPPQLRQWLAPLAPDEELSLDSLDAEQASAAVTELFADLATEPTDATVELRGGSPVVVPAEDGITCCEADSIERVWDALDASEPAVTLEARVVEPEVTTEDAEGWGIVEPIGGSRAWRAGEGDVSGPQPGFTTFYNPGEARNTNIQRMADIVSGSVVPPGGTFSINDHVGQRTTDKGFVPAGAIVNGQLEEEVGGGTSQFATTFFNAAYFAGLDITAARAHSLYFSRYPRGREATMGDPGTGLDVVISNNSPHGLLIQTSHTDTSVTVTFWSTEFARVEQTGISESPQNQCDHVQTTRTREFTDGSTATDTFEALYRPGDNLDCQGNQINPDPEDEDDDSDGGDGDSDR